MIDVASDDLVTPVPWTDGPVAADAEFAAVLGRPIPVPEGPRPFRRTSTVAELSDSRLGAVLAWLMRRPMDRMVPADDDGTMREMLDAMVTGLPLRGLATLGRGLTPALLDRVIALLNHEWRPALRLR